MSSKYKTILAIETSCDETSAAIVKSKISDHTIKSVSILSNVVSSQIKLHQKYHGVYPELASREHLNNIIPVVHQALKQAFKTDNLKQAMQKIDAIAVTYGPGLIGSLLSGTITAKTLGQIFNKPVIPVNHLEGHIYANFYQNENKIKFPLLTLIASGGHTSLIHMPNHLQYQIIGQTLDDAAGEAYDKVACMLGLDYPGGPIVDNFAHKYSGKNNHIFPRALDKKNNFNFSFSGVKTAVLYFLKKYPKPYQAKLIKQTCFEFQEAVTDILVKKTLNAANKYQVKSILLSGGVAANSRLREKLKNNSDKINAKIFIPERKFCTDNAFMIGVAASFKSLHPKKYPWYDIVATANTPLKSIK